MSNHPGISVIICTWNRSALLRTTLQSLNEQIDDEQLDVEVIVVDNNSTDDTKTVVEEVMAHWKLGELRYAFEPQQGKQFALNHGIRLSRHEILAFTDDDILFPKDWISHISHLFKDETLELAGGKTLIVWPTCGKPNWYDPTMLAILAGVDLGDEKLHPPPAGYAPAGSNLIARRSLFNRVGGFSETHFRHMDHEFGIRCAKAQVNIAYEPSLVVYAPAASACLTKRYFRRWSFKAGIADDGSRDASTTTFLLAPRWMYRQLVEDLVFLIFRSFLVEKSVAFSRELRLWRTLGEITSRWYAKFRPQHHAKWLEKYSQKKKDLY